MSLRGGKCPKGEVKDTRVGHSGCRRKSSVRARKSSEYFGYGTGKTGPAKFELQDGNSKNPERVLEELEPFLREGSVSFYDIYGIRNVINDNNTVVLKFNKKLAEGYGTNVKMFDRLFELYAIFKGNNYICEENDAYLDDVRCDEFRPFTVNDVLYLRLWWD